MTEDHLKTQLKQLLKRGYSEIDVVNMSIAPKTIVDQAIAEFSSEQNIAEKNLEVQHNQASYAMRLGG